MKIVQITDTHVEEPGALAYGRFDTAAALRRAFQAINDMSPKADLVLHTGDMAHHGSAERYTFFRDMQAELNAPFYAIPGNHDGRETFRTAFADCAWMPADGDFLHFTIEDYPVRVICCDSVRPGETPGGFCAERLGWLDNQLATAPDKPTIVALHHPPFGSGMTGASSQGLVAGGPEFAAILRRNPQVVRVIAGHSHRPYTCAFGGTIGYAAPTTCYPFALETGPERILSIIEEPPAIAVHLWADNAELGEPALVTHTVPLGDWPEPVVLLRDGKRVIAAG